MCGIAGFYQLDTPETEFPPLLGRMTAAMIHRWARRGGSWTAPELRVGIALRRLSIVHL